MTKPKKEKNVETKAEDKDSFAFKILHYKVYASSRQYTVRDELTESVDKKGKPLLGNLCGYFASLSGVLDSIRDDEIRQLTIGSKTLDEAIERIAQFNSVYEGLIEPLKKIELYAH